MVLHFYYFKPNTQCEQDMCQMVSVTGEQVHDTLSEDRSSVTFSIRKWCEVNNEVQS